jgi:hypothetical protein
MSAWGLEGGATKAKGKQDVTHSETTGAVQTIEAWLRRAIVRFAWDLTFSEINSTCSKPLHQFLSSPVIAPTPCQRFFRSVIYSMEMCESVPNFSHSL